MNKKVSIITPVYNVSAYLPQCIESVLNQTYRDIEFILVDDGSTDQSGTICDTYAQKDLRIKVIHQSNKGAACAKNTGLDNASGNYITFIDSDDYAEMNWIETMVNALETNNADAVECTFVKEYTDRSESGNTNEFKAAAFNAEEYMDQYLDYWTNSLFWNKLFKKELTDNIRFRYERRCIDDEFYTYKVISKADRIIRIEDSLIHYRQRRSSAVANEKNRLQITDDAIEVLAERYQWISNRFPSLSKKYLKHDIEILLYFGKSLNFTDRTAEQFHKITIYYLVECLKKKVNFRLWKEAMMLYLMKKQKLLTTKTNGSKGDIANYYP